MGIINRTTQAGWFPSLFGQQYLLNVIIVLALTIGTFIYLKYSKHGYEIAVTGESERTARYIGINVPRTIVRTMLLSGGICGLAGFVAVAGSSHTISTSTAGGRGFTAIIVAWLARLNPFVIVVVTALFSILEKGSSVMQSTFGLSSSVSQILQGIILFVVLAFDFFTRYALAFRRKEAKES